jgi:hypothetical protein
MKDMEVVVTVDMQKIMAVLTALAAAAASSGCAHDNGIEPVPAIDITLSSQAVTVGQNASEAITIDVTRAGGATGAVDLAVTGAPAGVMVTATPPSIADGSTSSVITITVAATAPIGPATLTVHATASGVAEQAKTVALTVTPAAVGGATAWEFCSAAAVPIWFAVQDGTGTWTRIAPAGTKFEFDIASGGGGIAYVTTRDFAGTALPRSMAALWSDPLEAARFLRNRDLDARAPSLDGAASAGSSSPARYDIFIAYGTQAELSAQGLQQCVPGNRVGGSVANLGVNQSAEVTLGTSSALVSGLDPTFQLDRVADGPLDLVASRIIVDPVTSGAAVDRLIIRRGLDQADNSTLPVLDFTTGEAFAPVVANLTVNNSGPGQAYVLSSVVTSGASRGAEISVTSGVSGPLLYYGVPSAKQAPGDLHFVAAFVFMGADVEFRGSGLYFTDPTDRTVTLGPMLPVPDVQTVSTTPSLRLRATGSLTMAYNRYVRVIFDQPGRSTTIEASAAYLSGATTYDVAIPDFTGVAGWVDDWGLKQGVPPTGWIVTGFGFTGDGVSRPAPVEGASFQFAMTSGTISP